MPQVRENVSLRPYNTFGLDASARWWLPIDSMESAVEFVVDNMSAEVPYFILGGGSNVLLTQNFEGVVLKNNILGKEVIQENEDTLYLRIGAGENWHETVLYCLEQNWGGIENLS